MTDPQGIPDDAPPPSVQRPYLYVPGEPLPADYPSSLNPPPVIEPHPNKKRWGQAGGGAAAGVGVAAKAGLLTKLFFVLKASAVLVKFKFAASMVISVVAYAFIFGWWYAVGFVGLIAVHEVGHMVALRSMGVKASLPTFIPFMGAFVTMKSAPKSVGHEATAALAGPAVGTFGALVTLELSHVFNSPLLRALAYTAFFINLFNLVPALPLDGGRVAGALHPALWIVGLAAAGIFAFVHPSPVLIFILIIGIFELVKRWRTRKWIDAAYYAIRPSTRVAIGSAYSLVAVVCLWGMSIAYVRR